MLVLVGAFVTADERASLSSNARRQASPAQRDTSGIPDAPTNVSPTDEATDVGAVPQLCATVSDPDADLLDVQFFGRDLTQAPVEDFTIMVIPDTQFYSQAYPQVFSSQTQWIVDNKEERNLAFVSHVGDCVHNPESAFEWSMGSLAMGLLEDPVTTLLPDGIPYGISVGNHDNANAPGTLEDQTNGSASLLYNQTFGISRFTGRSYYGGHFGTNNDNHYELFSASGMDFIVFHLEYDTWGGELRESVFDWVDGLLKTHSDRRAIVTSHYLLNPDGSFENYTYGPGNQGQATYDALKDNPNLFLMLCGHLRDNPHRSDTYNGNTINTLMSNYQHLENGGNGWLRILTFSAANNEIRVETYSPWLDEFNTEPHEQFTLPYDMEGGRFYRPIGSVSDVPSAATACLPWPGRQENHQYEWYVELSDGTSTTIGPAWSFSSNGACNLAEDCDDNDPCTSDSCTANVCVIDPIPNCCVTDDDCDDSNPCTDDACQTNSCLSSNNSSPCTDGDSCTFGDSCLLGVCSGSQIDCDDSNPCTSDFCSNGECENPYAPGSGCCTGDAQCDDANSCTTDSCDVLGDCSNVSVPDCCIEDVECVDADPCTTDFCSANRAGLHLDGTGAHASLSGTSAAEIQALNAAEFTIEIWFKWDGGGETTATSHIYNDSGGFEAYPLVTKGRRRQDTVVKANINYFLGIRVPGNVLAADFEEHSSGASPGLNHPVIGQTPVSVGVWHHAAATYDGCWQLFLDGQPETDGTNCPGEPPNFDSETQFALGSAQSQWGSTEGFFSGYIDEARVWKRALSQAEIQAAMTTEIEFAPGLLGRWGLDDGTGFVAADSSGNGNDLSLLLAEWEVSDLAPAGSNSCEFRPTPEVDGVLLDNRQGTTMLSWNYCGPEFTYDVASDAVPAMHSATCILDNGTDFSLVDPRTDPTPDEGYYYLIRTEGSCAGSYGTSSAGTERMPLGPCP